MRIAQVKKAKNLKRGDRVLVLNVDGQPQWDTVVSCETTYTYGWYDVQLEGIRDRMDIEGKTLVVVWG